MLNSLRIMRLRGLCRKMGVMAVMMFPALCLSCERHDDCRCPEKADAPCAHTDIALDQLDAATLARLKQEVAQALKEEAFVRWRHEFEMGMQTAVSPNANAAAPSVEPSRLPPTQAVERDPDGLKIQKITLSGAVVKRLPVDERDVFSISDTRVFCFVEIAAPRAQERTVTIRFTHSTGLTQSYDLPVNQSPAWRTWSKLNLTRAMTGTWLCEVFNEDDVLLASRSFVVVE